MKKTGIFLASLLAIGAVSCMENPGTGIPQTNPQQSVMTIEGVTVDFGTAIAGDAINLDADKDAKLQVMNLVEANNLPEGASMEFLMQIGADADFTSLQELNVDKDGTITDVDWDNAFKALFGKDPTPRDNYVRFLAYVNDGDNRFRLGGIDGYFAQKTIKVTPIDLKLPVESAYYLTLSTNGWAKEKFNHSDKHVYDDPSFNYVIEVVAGTEWKVVSESGKTFGVETAGDTSLSGFLVEGGGAGKIDEEGKFVMAINMLEGTYEFIPKGNLWTPGNSNGWNHAAAQMLYQEGVTFYGYAYLDGEFKFTNTDNWDGTNYGAGDAEGKLSTDPSAGNLNSNGTGLFWCEVKPFSLEYSLTPVTSIGLIGDFNGWADDIALIPSDNYLTWEGELTLEKAGGWKFRMNNGWDLNLGGSESELTQNGANIASEAGTYVVTLDLSKLPYSCTVLKK